MNHALVDTLLSERDLALYVGLSLPTLQRMRSYGGGPRFVRLSERRIAYRKSDIEAWLAARTTDRVGRAEVHVTDTAAP
jgi:predicted DNA-binding transcriptional regulator AlpA